MIVRTSDFQLDAYIPNKDDAPFADLIGNEGELQGFIDEYETEVLIRVLGYDLYNEYMDAFEPDGTYSPGADDKWKLLTDGFENYRGIKPLIIGYVFWKFIESDDSHYTSTHVVVERTTSAAKISSRSKALLQYQKFLDYAVGNYYENPYVENKRSIFGNTKIVIWGGAHASRSNFMSLYQYLEKNLEDFEDWSPERLNEQNHFDI
jgi:hypothetical protein